MVIAQKMISIVPRGILARKPRAVARGTRVSSRRAHKGANGARLKHRRRLPMPTELTESQAIVNYIEMAKGHWVRSLPRLPGALCGASMTTAR